MTQLCAIYERTGGIPDRPKSVYRRVVRLMLEEWDEQRRIKRESAYSNFDVDEKYEFLCRLAFHFSVTKSKYQMTTEELKQAYDTMAPQYGLPRGERSQAVKELESHTGLFVQSGAETYESSHKSLQETWPLNILSSFRAFRANAQLSGTSVQSLPLLLRFPQRRQAICHSLFQTFSTNKNLEVTFTIPFEQTCARDATI